MWAGVTNTADAAALRPGSGTVKLVTLAWLLLIGIVTASCGEIKFDPMLVLASHMEGTLVDKDLRPVANVRIERTWEWAWTGKKGSDVSTTDTQGHFEFPKVTRFSVTAFLPHQPQIYTDIIAHGPAGPVLLYQQTKPDYDDRSETDGKLFNIIFRIDLEPGVQLGKFWGTAIEIK
jgi:hypothetical protein